MSDAVPEYLYHYTSADGLHGILTPVKDEGDSAAYPRLWATHSAFLNDSREVEHGKDLFRAEIGRRGALPQRRKGMSQRPDMARLYSHATDGLHTYVVSLSEKGDDLSQWRAYCRGGGYAIGFVGKALYESVSYRLEPTFAMQRCLYSASEQQNEVSHLCNQLMISTDNVSPFDALEIDSIASSEFQTELTRLCCSMKDPAFASESEWRFMGGGNHPTKYRARAGVLIPYLQMKLPPLDNVSFWRTCRIVVGPTRFEEMALKGARSRLAAALGLEHPHEVSDQVQPSHIPFREF